MQAYCKFDGKRLNLQSLLSPFQTFSAQSQFAMSTVFKLSFIMHYSDKGVPLQKFQETLICGTNSSVDISQNIKILPASSIGPIVIDLSSFLIFLLLL